MSGFPAPSVWRAACQSDPVLSVWSGPWSACFAIESDGVSVSFDFVDGQVRSGDGTALFTLAAPGTIWAKFLLPVPPRHHHGIFPMMYRVPEFAIGGSTVAFMQHAHLARRVLDIVNMARVGPRFFSAISRFTRAIGTHARGWRGSTPTAAACSC